MGSTERSAYISTVFLIAGFIEKTTRVFAVLLGGAMTVIVIAGVIARYVMQNPMVWTEEVARGLMIWTAYLGISIAMKNRAHLGVVFFATRLPPSLQLILKFLTDLAIVVFLGVLIWWGLDMVDAGRYQIEPATGITMNYPFMIIPICGILTLVQCLLQMLIDFSLWGTGRSPHDPGLAGGL